MPVNFFIYKCASWIKGGWIFLATSPSRPSNYPATKGYCKTAKYTHTQKRDLISVIFIDHLRFILKLYVPYAAQLHVSNIQILKRVLYITYSILLCLPVPTWYWYNKYYTLNPATHYLCLLNNNNVVKTIFFLWPLSALDFVRYEHNSYATEYHPSRLLNLLANYTLSVDQCWKWNNALQIHDVYLKLLLSLQSSE